MTKTYDETDPGFIVDSLEALARSAFANKVATITMMKRDHGSEERDPDD